MRLLPAVPYIQLRGGSGTTSKRQFVAKVGFVRSDGTPAPKPDGLSLGSPSFATSFLKTKDLLKGFGSGMKYENVPPHATGPPNFPHSWQHSRAMPSILA